MTSAATSVTLAFSSAVFALALHADPALSQEPGDEFGENVEEAKNHFQEGVKFFNEKKWEKALREFQEAFDLKPHWKIRYNIGLCYIRLEFWAQAMTEMTLMVEEGGGNVPTHQLQKVTSMMDSLRNKVGVLTLEGRIEEAHIYIDGKPIIGLAAGGILFLNPGEHRVEARVGGKTAVAEDVVLTGGQKKTLELRIPAEAFQEKKSRKEEKVDEEPGGDFAPPEKRKPAPAVIAGSVLAAAAGAALMGGAGTGIHAIVEKGRQDDAYDSFVSGKETSREKVEAEIDEHYGKARSSALASTILLSVGGGLAAVSIVLFLLPGKKKERREAAPAFLRGVELAPAPGGITVAF